MTQTQAQQRTTEAPAPQWQNLATKADLAELRTRLEYMATREDLAELRGEFPGLRAGSGGPRTSLGTDGWFHGLVFGLKVGLVVALVQIGLFFLQRSLG
ncbi:MAG: hypothetical protein OXB89_03060 [Anaerolineaceae bacterium]|nr:hypothetical protein [Anaerolineaceae bacterium]